MSSPVPGFSSPVVSKGGRQKSRCSVADGDRWVYWSETDYAGLGKSEWPKHYDADDSSTGFEITGAEWSVQYGDPPSPSPPPATSLLTSPFSSLDHLPTQQTTNTPPADGTQASGPVALDTLTLTTLHLPNATLQLANTTSPSLLDSGASGVMGLARTLRTSIVPYDVPTVRERLVEAGQRFLSIDLRAGGGSYRFSDSEAGGAEPGKGSGGGRDVV